MSLALPRRVRQAVVAGLTLAVTASTATLMTAAPAHAADRTVFKVIGTADVYDSHLVQDVLEPRFEALYPQYDLQYTTGGTGKAIAGAKTGAFAAMIVHAAALENQFVADGYSSEPAGRAIFWGDYVLIGPPDDPAGVMSGGGAHDIVTAFEKIAAAGANGTADFASRGGTPGTSVQERYLWGLSNIANYCTVAAADGGGKLPSNTPGNCPTTTPSNSAGIDATDVPSWYHINAGASQASNIQLGNACNYANRSGKCYVFTDRGTFNYLQQTSSPGGLSLVQLTRNNATTARGGLEALINSFHAYSINPAKFGTPGGTDAVAAKLFLDFLTSTTTQAAVGAYLNGTNDPPFIPAASPKLTGSLVSTELKDGKKAQVTGSVKNVIPGTPALGGVPVNLVEASSDSPLAVPTTVATATTDAAGTFSIKAELKPGRSYRVAVGPITKVERPDLNPVFSDILTATSTQIGTVSGLKFKRLKKKSNARVAIKAKVLGNPTGASKVKVYAAQKGKLRKIDKVKLKAGATTFRDTVKLQPGKWKVQLVFVSDGHPTWTTKKRTVKLS